MPPHVTTTTSHGLTMVVTVVLVWMMINIPIISVAASQDHHSSTSSPSASGLLPPLLSMSYSKRKPFVIGGATVPLPHEKPKEEEEEKEYRQEQQHVVEEKLVHDDFNQDSLSTNTSPVTSDSSNRIDDSDEMIFVRKHDGNIEPLDGNKVRYVDLEPSFVCFGHENSCSSTSLDSLYSFNKKQQQRFINGCKR